MHTGTLHYHAQKYKPPPRPVGHPTQPNPTRLCLDRGGRTSKHLFDLCAIDDLVPVVAEQLALEERGDVVYLEILCAGLELLDGNAD